MSQIEYTCILYRHFTFTAFSGRSPAGRNHTILTFAYGLYLVPYHLAPHMMFDVSVYL